MQAAAVSAWWLLLLRAPRYRLSFQVDDASEAALLAFWLPDLLLVAGGSARDVSWSADHTPG